MIKVLKLSVNSVLKEVQVELFADTQSEVTNNLTLDQIPDGYSIAQGSSVITASADFAFRKSDGTWSWI